MEYQIKYGSAFAVDQFGFVGKGKINIGEETVELFGKKHWSVLARLGIFLAITVLPIVLFGFGIGFLLALVVIHYFCASPGSVKFNKHDLKEVKRWGRKITFKTSIEDVSKLKKSLFNATNEEDAKAIESSLFSS